MPLWQALILGLVQGATEFLPVSSSGHLQVIPWMFGWDDLEGQPDLERAFDVALHLGTFVGAAGYFRADIVRLSKAGLAAVAKRRIETDDERAAVLLALSSVPAAAVGATLDALLEGDFIGEGVIGVLLIVFGILLWLSDRVGSDRPASSWRALDALVMGTAQALALFPGVSRSGATITSARFLGLSRDAATRLSFLMALPVTAGAITYEGVKLVRAGGIPPGFGGAFVVGIGAAAVTGFGAVWGLLKLVRTRSFAPFVLYRVIAGAVVIAVAAARS